MEILDFKLLNLIAIIFFCGITGGIGNTLRENNIERKTFIKNIVLGIIASITVPLFLQLVSSGIISDIITKEENHLTNYFVFSGFCIIASFSSISFLNSISGRILQNIEDEIRNLKNDNEILKTDSQRIDNNLNAIAISDEKSVLDQKDLEKISKPEYIEIMNSIQNESKNFRPLETIKQEVNQDNSEIEKKINILVEKNLIKEFTLNDGSKAVALSEGAEIIVNDNKIQ